ncbi:TetR/AcrR family transcriptional regulator [Chelatococcus reniformis]|uniref:HTH tetR-type domain-containing protein n=1 Tax=Chelatococcus reniformis TaxID=1494448 RepID=A0A916UIP1_9HYPH|nr:TetR/AcrR family transcriptional regulator [Chelatococcus reniformis]GGC74504.1 hypothetical protein GCM10010994_36210 [Chelatococcus reniformis]
MPGDRNNRSTTRGAPLGERKAAKPAGRPRGRPPKDLGAGDTSRDKLLDVAIDLFAAYGYDPVSTAAVADAAGLTQSMVHYHFGTKEQLWKSAIDRLMRRRGRFFPVSRLEFADIGPVDRLRILIRRLVEANAAEPNYARILMHEAMAGTPRLDWLMERFVGPGFAAFDEAVRDALAAGLIRPLPAHDITNIVTSAASLTLSIGAVTQWVYGIDVADEAHVRSLSDSIATILLNGLLPPPQT